MTSAAKLERVLDIQMTAPIATLRTRLAATLHTGRTVRDGELVERGG
jgi:hypothetical protein